MTDGNADLPAPIRRAWRGLRDHGPIDRDSLRLLLTGTTNVDEVLHDLELLGLASSSNGRWSAVDASEIQATMAERAERIGAQLRQNDLSAEASWGGSIELLHGLPAINAFLKERIGRAELVQGFDLPPYVAVRNDPSQFTDEGMHETMPEILVLERGGQLQSVYHPDGFADDPTKVKEVGAFVERGEQARVGKVHTKLVLFDREEALVGLMSSYRQGVPEEVWSLRTTHPILVDSFRSQFDTAWESSAPWLGAGAAGKWADRRLQLMQYFYAGFDLDGIAAASGISKRTLRRDLERLKDDFGVSNTSAFLTGVRIGIMIEQSKSQGWA